MSCKGTIRRLNAYLDGELSPRKAQKIQKHLEQCPRCAAALEELDKLNRLVASAEGLPERPGFARRVRLIAQERRLLAGRLMPAPLQLALARVAAALMLAAGVGLGVTAGSSAARGAIAPVQIDSSDLTALDVTLDALSMVQVGSMADVYLGYWSSEGGE